MKRWTFRGGSPLFYGSARMRRCPKLKDHPEIGLGQAYDLVLNGLEVGEGVSELLREVEIPPL